MYVNELRVQETVPAGVRHMSEQSDKTHTWRGGLSAGMAILAGVATQIVFAEQIASRVLHEPAKLAIESLLFVGTYMILFWSMAALLGIAGREWLKFRKHWRVSLGALSGLLTIWVFPAVVQEGSSRELPLIISLFVGAMTWFALTRLLPPRSPQPNGA
jgi:hypothetical protein